MTDLEKKARLLNEYVVRLVSHFSQEQENCIKHYGNLTMHELKIVEYLGLHDSAIMRDLTLNLRLAESTMTSIADKMVQKELILRERSEKDRRIVKIVLSAKGLEIFKKSRESALKSRAQMLKTLSGEEQKTLLALFKKMIDQLEMP